MSKKIFILFCLLFLLYTDCQKQSNAVNREETEKLRNFLIKKSELNLRFSRPQRIDVFLFAMRIFLRMNGKSRLKRN